MPPKSVIECGQSSLADQESSIYSLYLLRVLGACLYQMEIGTEIELAKLVGDGGHVAGATRNFGRRCSRWGLHSEILGRRGNLPIWQHKDEFLKVFTQHQALILVAEPGSGKSTQVPQFVLEAVANDTQSTTSESQGSKYMIGCTQPQRVAAMSASQQVAKEMDVTLGEEVG